MILVTGGTGLVGAHLLYFLAKSEKKIRAIYRDEKSIKKTEEVFSYYTKDASLLTKIEWFKADITDVPAMIPAFVGIKQLYHCAALISFDAKDYKEMRKVNIHGTAIMVNLAIDAKIDKICFVSSIASIGNSLKGDLITEENEWNKEADNSWYSITKFGAEMEIWRASQEGVKVVVVNPGVILGSGLFATGSGKIISKIYKGFNFYTEGITGFVGVKDVVKAMILLMDSDIKNERFILVSENKSFKDVFFLIADAFQKKRPSFKIKPYQTAILWRVSWLLSKITNSATVFSKYAAKSGHSMSKYSSKKIEESLDFKFETISDVVNRTCKNYTKFLE